MSPLIKFLEARFLNKIMRYLDTQLNKAQTGFVPGRGCHVNITRLLEKVKNIKKEKNKNQGVLFIDFSNAFNTVNRELLYRILKEKSILTTWETEWLQGLHERLELRMENHH